VDAQTYAYTTERMGECSAPVIAHKQELADLNVNLRSPSYSTTYHNHKYVASIFHEHTILFTFICEKVMRPSA
jgi:hypothetical protein